MADEIAAHATISSVQVAKRNSGLEHRLAAMMVFAKSGYPR
jgi:hypothetical protein